MSSLVRYFNELNRDELYGRRKAARARVLNAAAAALKAARENWALLTAGAFAVAASLQQIVFASWGLNYFQIASPTDVLMGGIDFSARAGGALFAFSAGAVLVSLVVKVAERWIYVAIIVALASGLAYFAREVPIFRSADLWLFAGAFFWGAFSGDPDIQNDDSVRSIEDPMQRRLAHERQTWEGLFMWGVLLLPVSAALTLWGLADTGFQPTRTYLTQKPLGCAGEVLWVGSERVVFRCNPGRRGVRVAIGDQEGLLEVRELAPAGRKPSVTPPANTVQPKPARST